VKESRAETGVIASSDILNIFAPSGKRGRSPLQGDNLSVGATSRKEGRNEETDVLTLKITASHVER